MNLSIQAPGPVFLTGGSGRIGSYIVRGLSQAGYIVTSMDRVEPQFPVEGVKYIIGDITDFNFILEHINGAEALIHLAALPSPGMGSTREIMRINVLGTFNVFQAAVKRGLKKVIQASSINYLGIAYGVKMFRPKYFPVDEEHPSLISDAYSLSKKMDEEIADYFWLRDNMSSFSLRFPGVFSRSWLENWSTGRRKSYFEIVIQELEKKSPDERMKLIENVFEKSKDKEYRKAAKSWEDASEEEKIQWVTASCIIRAIRELYAYLELSDCLQGIIKCLQADIAGTYPLFLNGPDTGRKIETMRLARIFFPWVKEFRKELKGNEPLVSYQRAKSLIGFDPKFSLIEHWQLQESKEEKKNCPEKQAAFCSSP
ncbi:MAG TPA: NAD(P)-dependent oxidoreductase [Victivallales bacterium]|nr:NAD(P)-dependent oxidoreductase [Victivallales bacterium]HPO90178.1 NAD(P)-dependent oxidoreductase [Victivallales bacterium]HRR06758.1 NAD(P)-dependent oxidoreductase [Victivallales bacterium]HRR28597.1 NAD(P)-dependent oxidoreductase [Victivallales bacterium]HRU00069.1 NAD(P)-dependent oxidoreductase [Victivallales bacterium]